MNTEKHVIPTHLTMVGLLWLPLLPATQVSRLFRPPAQQSSVLLTKTHKVKSQELARLSPLPGNNEENRKRLPNVMSYFQFGSLTNPRSYKPPYPLAGCVAKVDNDLPPIRDYSLQILYIVIVEIINEELIAPCGMNCAICSGYLALKHDVKSQGIRMPYCNGCRERDKKCAFLKKRCNILMNGDVKYCYECSDFPCKRLETVDKRYRSFFRTSLIENLEYIRTKGIGQFLVKEQEKWKCPECGGMICCHNGLCFECSLDRLRQKKQKYRWEEK